MKLWEKFSDLGITKKLRLFANAVLDVNGVEVELHELQQLSASDRLVSLTETAVTIAPKQHAGKTLLMAEPGGDAEATYTLPAATGSGDRYRFVVSVVNTSNYVIQAGEANDTFNGNVIAVSTGDTPDLAQPWAAGASDDTLTLNGTTQGGAAVGDFVEFEDIGTDTWRVSGLVTASGTEATPFSSAVS